MCAAWDRLLAKTLPKHRRDALRPRFYDAPSRRVRYAMLLEFASYLQQNRATAERTAAVDAGDDATLEALDEMTDNLHRHARKDEPQSSLGWLLCRVSPQAPCGLPSPRRCAHGAAADARDPARPPRRSLPSSRSSSAPSFCSPLAQGPTVTSPSSRNSSI
jgi:hypothetical protein